MRKRLKELPALAILLIAGCAAGPQGAGSTLIVNASVIDGTGAAAAHVSVRIDNDRIIAVGNLQAKDGENIVDASGLVLAPGFIDPHSHHASDLQNYRHMPGVLSQGVTTIARGVDGANSMDDGFAFQPVAEFNEAFSARPAAVNIVSFSAHGGIRSKVMGDDYRREATPAEIESMQDLVNADMRAGAIGFSTGLEYEPGIYSSTHEITELARVAARYGGSYSSHVRDEDDRIMEAMDEVILIARDAGIRANISHIKLADMAYWNSADKVIARLEDAIAHGADIRADIYPYLRWQSNLAVLFPHRDYSDADTARYTFAHTATPENILLVEFAPNPDFNNMTIADIADATRRNPVELLLALSREADLYQRKTGRDGASIIAKGMNDADVAAFMQWRFTSICSDGSHASGHPRGHGAFPRVLGHYVRELGILTLAEAIHKMTGLTAESLQLSGRGRIEPGAYADLVLLDADTIGDRATMEDPTAMSIGVEKVWVNGVVAFSDGKPTGEFTGRAVGLDRTN